MSTYRNHVSKKSTSSQKGNVAVTLKVQRSNSYAVLIAENYKYFLQVALNTLKKPKKSHTAAYCKLHQHELSGTYIPIYIQPIHFEKKRVVQPVFVRNVEHVDKPEYCSLGRKK